jgi:hypothetical protein
VYMVRIESDGQVGTWKWVKFWIQSRSASGIRIEDENWVPRCERDDNSVSFSCPEVEIAISRVSLKKNFTPNVKRLSLQKRQNMVSKKGSPVRTAYKRSISAPLYS